MDRLSCLLTEASNKTKNRLSQKLKTYNITCRQAVVLSTLKEGSFSAVSIRKTVGIDKATLSLILNKLIKQEFVGCITNEDDKREKLYFATKKGLEVLSAAGEIEKQCYNDFLEKLTENEYETLIDLLNKLI